MYLNKFVVKLLHHHRVHLLFLLTLLTSVGLNASTVSRSTQSNIIIVTGDNSAFSKNVVDDLLKKYPLAQQSTLPNAKVLPSKKAIIIAVGPSALNAVISQNIEGVVVSIHSSSQVYRSMLATTPIPMSMRITAIYAEQSPSVQLKLVELLYIKPSNVAVILSEKSAYLEVPLEQAAKQLGITLQIQRISPNNSIVRILSRLKEGTTILAVPDNAIYNDETIRSILLTSYRRDQTLIGFSEALVKAGALAATVSSVQDTNVQLYELISELESSEKLPEPSYPKYFEVIVNETVARSLNLIIGNEARNFSRKPASGKL
jgi:putative ABC transport system substrate-binding protein